MKPVYLRTFNVRKPISVFTQAGVLVFLIDFNEHLRPKIEIKVKKKSKRERGSKEKGKEKIEEGHKGREGGTEERSEEKILQSE